LLNIIIIAENILPLTIMKRKLLFIPVLLLIAFSFYTCCKAGLGGKATLTVSVYSDSKNPIKGAVVYIKYGQSKPPANINSFDNKITAPANGNTVSFTNLGCGTYYLFATGYDSVLASPISGGSPLTITHSARAKTTTTNIYITP
jgi:hypothetical protein